MKSMRAKKGRSPARRTDDTTINVALKISSLMVWFFYSAAALYVAYCNSFFLEGEHELLSAQSMVGKSAPSSLLHKMQLSHKYSRAYYFFFPQGFDIAAFLPLVVRALVFSAAASGCTYYLANKYENGGEMLMFLAWFIGVLSERYWLTSPVSLTTTGPSGLIRNATQAGVSVGSGAMGGDGAELLVVYDSRIPTVPGWLWLVVSIGTGFFSGLMSKVKDLADGKIERGHHLLGIFDEEDTVDTTAVRIDDVRVLHKRLQEDEQAGRAAVRDSSSAPPASGGMEGTTAMTARRRRARGSRNFGSRFVAIGERLYIVVPFCTGQWFAFILRHGWRGIFIENCILVLTLGMIGYTMLSFKLLREQVYRVSGRTTVVRYRRTVPVGADGNETVTVVEEDEVETSVDLIDLISKIFTTSFGAVGVAVVAVNVFITMLAIPFIKTLVQLNALVSSVGILVELFVYEMA